MSDCGDDLRAAFDALYRAHHLLVLRTTSRILHDPADVDDAVQNTFVNAWLHFNSCPRQRIEAWLTTVAKHCAVDIVRKRIPSDARFLLESLPDPDTDDLDEAAARIERIRWLQWEINRLESEQRRLLVASFFEGQSHRALANATGLPLGTVKTRIRKAVSNLRREMPGPEQTPFFATPVNHLEDESVASNPFRAADKLFRSLDSQNVIAVVSLDGDCRDVRFSSALLSALRLPEDFDGSGCSRGATRPYRYVKHGREINSYDLPLCRAMISGAHFDEPQLDCVFEDIGTIVKLHGTAIPLFDERGNVNGGAAIFSPCPA